jgi:integrase/recombinase XerC
MEHLDRANRRARTIRKGGKVDDLLYDIRTARMLGQLLGRRRAGPVFLSARRAPEGTARTGEVDPASRRLRMTYRTAECHLGTATTSTLVPNGWDLHLRHSRLTHAGEDGATEADLMNLSGHEDRRTLQRYLKPSKEGTRRRLDEIDAHRPTWTPSADELAARLTNHLPADRRHPQRSPGARRPALFSQRLLPGGLLASVGDVFAYGGGRFSGEAFEYIGLVAGQDEGADAVLEGHLG